MLPPYRREGGLTAGRAAGVISAQVREGAVELDQFCGVRTVIVSSGFAAGRSSAENESTT
jgi:hypothetical protein